jgi:hypothetical protein
MAQDNRVEEVRQALLLMAAALVFLPLDMGLVLGLGIIVYYCIAAFQRTKTT